LSSDGFVTLNRLFTWTAAGATINRVQTAISLIRATLVTAVLLFNSCSGKHSTSAMAKILALEEIPPQNRADGRTTRPMQAGQLLATGETFQLRPGQKATVAFTLGIIVALSDQAEVEIIKFRLAKDGNETGSDLTERDVEMRVSKGSLIGSVAPDALKTTFILTAGPAHLSFEPGSLFYLDISDEEFHVTSVRGTVRLLHDGRQVTILPPGNWLHWPKGQPGPSEPEIAAASGRAQQEVTSALEAEAAMQLLLAVEQKAVPEWRHP
jgi:hypothetical protein